MENEIGIIK